MKYDCSVSSTTHARIRNADHVCHAFAQQFRWYGHIPNFRHARITARAAVLQDHHAIFVNVQALIIDTRVEVLDVFENNGAPAMLKQVWTGRGRFDHSAIRSEIASEHGDASARFERFRKATDHVPVPALRIRHILPDRPPIYGQSLTSQHTSLAQLAEHRWNATCIVEIFHEVFARRLQINQARQI